MSAPTMPLKVIPVPVGDAVELGVVSVHVYGFGDATATCSCGWTGRRRFLKAAAQQDAWAHSIHDKCVVSSPLLLAW